jgi:putative membrane protein
MITILAGLLALGVSAPAPAPHDPAPHDAAFLRATHQADLAEIAAGNIAMERGASPAVRELGARFVRDHTAIEEHLTAVARSEGVSLPDTPTRSQLALTHKYQSVPAAGFDALYVRTQLAAHNAASAAGKAELASGKDARVKALVSYAAPLVEAHHDALMSFYGSHGR